MSLKIIRAGLLDSIQDCGRTGLQHLGIATAGAMDVFSARMANAILGLPEHNPVLELHFPAAVICFQSPAFICLAGADFDASLNGEPFPLLQPAVVPAETILRFHNHKKGARCYLAMMPAIAAENWQGSYSTDFKTGTGGFQGRKLQKDDMISFSSTEDISIESIQLLPWRSSFIPEEKDRVAVLKGNEYYWLSASSMLQFEELDFFITTQSDRMGYRLTSEAMELNKTDELVSSPVSFGTVQCLPSGQLIVLMADHQTTGGYPRLATVISADHSLLAQKSAGEKISFSITSIDEAEDRLMKQEKFLEQLHNTCQLKMINYLHDSGYQL